MSKKILLADDSITIQKVIELTFSDEDFDVVTVGNGRLALEKLPDVRPDVVLCDIVMPEKDGYEVCERIKTDPETSHIPVLLLTGAFEPFDQEKAARVGSDGFLAKPFEPETLIAKVKELLARAPVRTAPPGPAFPRTEPPAAPAPRPEASTAPTARAEPPAAPPSRYGASTGLTPRPEASTAPNPRAEPPTVQTPRGEPQRSAAPPPLPTGPHAVPPAAARSAVPPVVVPRPPERPAPSFVPEEPFDAFDAEAIDEPASGPSSDPPLAPVTAEESATLSGEDVGASAPADAASTVMFRPDDVPWAPPREPHRTAAPSATLEPEPEMIAEPEPFLTPEPVEDDSVADEEAPTFEEVLEEDFEFGVADESEPPVPASPRASAAMEHDAEDLSAERPRSSDEASTGRFRAPVFTAHPATETAPPVPPEPPSPPPVYYPTSEAYTEEVEVHELEPEGFAPTEAEADANVTQAPVPPPEESFADVADAMNEAPVAAPDQSFAVTDAGDEAPVPPPDESFADVADAVNEAPVPPPDESFADVANAVADADRRAPAGSAAVSEAAAVPVPVDMVEKIAQRVVAQVSERVVREIAWEVIPDLAEALIKQEIERLKAELQKL